MSKNPDQDPVPMNNPDEFSESFKSNFLGQNKILKFIGVDPDPGWRKV
jgi:hypothetical protein